MIDVNWTKLDERAQEPKRGTRYAAGWDLVAIDRDFDPKHAVVSYRTGIAMEIPRDYVGLLFPRSSVYKTGLIHADAVGVIDSDYRGEIVFRFYAYDFRTGIYNVGDRVGQIVFVPAPNVWWWEKDKLSDTERGDGGFGSTGK